MNHSRSHNRSAKRHTGTVRLLALLPLLASGAAMAHPGHGDGALAGFAHPMLGLDHLLAMLAVGVLAMQQGGRARWLLPVSFVACLAAGAAFGMAGVQLPLVEGGIATSVLLLGLLIAFAVKLPLAPAAAMVSVFAVFHGHAHGVEMPLQSSAWAYGAGFVLASALLHGAGYAVGARLQRDGVLLRAAGGAIALAGVWMGAMA